MEWGHFFTTWRRFLMHGTQIQADLRDSGIETHLMEQSYGVEMAGRARAAGLYSVYAPSSAGVDVKIPKKDVPSLFLYFSFGFRIRDQSDTIPKSDRNSYARGWWGAVMTGKVSEMLRTRKEEGVIEKLQQLGDPDIRDWPLTLDGFANRHIAI
jgi:hypothetical protein